MWKKLWVLALAVLAFSGCSATATQNNLSRINFVKANSQMGDKTPEERAESIKKFLHQINGLKGNAVIVEGHTAIIGLRLEKGMEDDITRLSREAYTAARQADEYIDNTSITTNERIVSLIEEMERKRAS